MNGGVDLERVCDSVSALARILAEKLKYNDVLLSRGYRLCKCPT